MPIGYINCENVIHVPTPFLLHIAFNTAITMKTTISVYTFWFRCYCAVVLKARLLIYK
jgi:hypothetical protein